MMKRSREEGPLACCAEEDMQRRKDGCSCLRGRGSCGEQGKDAAAARSWLRPLAAGLRQAVATRKEMGGRWGGGKTREVGREWMGC